VDGECLFDDECGWMSMRVGLCALGAAVQLAPMKPTLKAPGINN